MVCLAMDHFKLLDDCAEPTKHRGDCFNLYKDLCYFHIGPTLPDEQTYEIIFMLSTAVMFSI